MTEKHSFLAEWLTFKGLVDLAFILAVSCSLLGLGVFGKLHWALDLFSHFRWQYFILCVLGLVWSFGFRRPGLVRHVCLVLLLMNGMQLYQVNGNAAFAVTEGPRLRVVSLNVLTSNPNKQGVLEYLRACDADVIFLMEVGPAWVSSLEGLKDSHPHALIRSQQDNFGCALFSRVPLAELRLIQSGGSDMPSILARLTHRDREMVLLGTHPLPPAGKRMSLSRDAQLKNLADEVARLKVPVLLIGDLNATPWSCGMSLLKAGTRLEFRSPAAAWMPTWKVGSLFAVPIDHALCTPPLAVARRVIGQEVGSDHRPQELEIGWLR